MAKLTQKDIHQAIKEIAAAIIDGTLDARCKTEGLSGSDAHSAELINGMLDAMVTPLKLSCNALDSIAHGVLPPFVIEDFAGEYNRVKQSVNTLLAILYGMHAETQHLVRSIDAGDLTTRGNQWDYQGVWCDLIDGMNQAINAVVEPIRESGLVLERLADYDLTARMNGKYRGDHAAIRKALNKTAEALQGAIVEVAESVGTVAIVGDKITEISSEVAKGAEEQKGRLEQTSSGLNELVEIATESAQKSEHAITDALQATSSILKARESMGEMVASMGLIDKAANDTVAVTSDIESIAQETGTVAIDAVVKSDKMRTSASGFDVLAKEVRRLSGECIAVGNEMLAIAGRVSDQDQEVYHDLISRVNSIARLANLIGVNAAIESAHVDGTGNDFSRMTENIRALAQRVAEAAVKTESLTSSAATLSHDGVVKATQIQEQLAEAAKGAEAIKGFSGEIAKAIQTQATGLEQISQTATGISQITGQNSEGAAQALVLVRDLGAQVERLRSLVVRFTY